MKVTLERIDDDYLLDARGPNGVSVSIDNKTAETVKGASPMELVLMAIGGCNAIDIISILKKQRQPIDAYRVEVTGTREEVLQAKPFKAAHVVVYLEGDIQPAKALRAAQLSFEKYCSVSITMSGCVEVTYEVILNGTKIE